MKIIDLNQRKSVARLVHLLNTHTNRQIDLQVVHGRLKKGMGLKAALFTPVEKTEPTLYEYQGQKMTLTQIAKLTGIKPGTLSNRLKSGMSLEEALSAKGRELYEYQGQRLTLAEIAKLVGMPQATLHARVHRSGWSLEKALSEPIEVRFRRKSELPIAA